MLDPRTLGALAAEVSRRQLRVATRATYAGVYRAFCQQPWGDAGVVTTRHGKRRRTRQVPLDADALQALVAWIKVRPTAADDQLLLSLPGAGHAR